MNLKVVLLSTMLVVVKSFNAQKSQHLGLFPTIDHSASLTKKLDYSIYYFGAFNLLNSKVNKVTPPSNFFAFYAENALTCSVNSKLSFTGSYVYERQFPAQSNYRNENRFFVHTTYKHDVKRFKLKHSLRFDGRFIEDRITKTSPFTSRLRYLFGISANLKKDSDTFYAYTYNEFFFNLNKSAGVVYGENWANASLGMKINSKNSLELGLLHIFGSTIPICLILAIYNLRG